ncbi:MAG: hypothetical protein AAF996_03205 [Pseudomonadota bacterium]
MFPLEEGLEKAWALAVTQISAWSATGLHARTLVVKLSTADIRSGHTWLLKLTEGLSRRLIDQQDRLVESFRLPAQTNKYRIEQALLRVAARRVGKAIGVICEGGESRRRELTLQLFDANLILFGVATAITTSPLHIAGQSWKLISRIVVRHLESGTKASAGFIPVGHDNTVPNLKLDDETLAWLDICNRFALLKLRQNQLLANPKPISLEREIAEIIWNISSFPQASISAALTNICAAFPDVGTEAVERALRTLNDQASSASLRGEARKVYAAFIEDMRRSKIKEKIGGTNVLAQTDCKAQVFSTLSQMVGGNVFDAQSVVSLVTMGLEVFSDRYEARMADGDNYDE